jgi:hypothetical protein
MKNDDKIPLVMALALRGIESGDFQISTLNKETFHSPQNDFELIDYIQHGGRVMFDYSKLDAKQKAKLKKVLNQIKRDGVERFSTHDLKNNKTNGVVEKTLNFFSAQIRNNSWGQDFSFNIENKKEVKSGHALFVEGKDCFMVGFEKASATLSNCCKGDHSILGTPEQYSWANKLKFDDQEYMEKQAQKGNEVPLKYNGMRVVLNNKNFDDVLQNLLDKNYNPLKEVGYNSNKESSISDVINPYAKPQSSQEKDKDNRELLDTVKAKIDEINKKKEDKKSDKKKQSRFIKAACCLLIIGMVSMMVLNPVFAAAMGYALGSFALSAMVLAARKTGINWLKKAGPITLSIISHLALSIMFLGIGGILPTAIGYGLVGAVVISVILNKGLNSRYYDIFHKAINFLFLALAIGCLALPILILPVVTVTYRLALVCMLGVLRFVLIQFKIKKFSPLVKALVTSVSLSASVMGISGAMMPSILAQASALLGIAALPMAVQGLIILATISIIPTICLWGIAKACHSSDGRVEKYKPLMSTNEGKDLQKLKKIDLNKTLSSIAERSVEESEKSYNPKPSDEFDSVEGQRSKIMIVTSENLLGDHGQNREQENLNLKI